MGSIPCLQSLLPYLVLPGADYHGVLASTGEREGGDFYFFANRFVASLFRGFVSCTRHFPAGFKRMTNCTYTSSVPGSSL